MKSRGAYETPGGTLLIKATRNSNASPSIANRALPASSIESLCRTRLQRRVVLCSARIARRLLHVAQQFVTGQWPELWKGTLNVTSRKSPSRCIALIWPASPWAATTQDAEGFINLFALPSNGAPKAKAESGKPYS